MDKQVIMNEHAHKVFLFLNRGHSKELSPNIRLRYKIGFILFMVLWGLITLILFFSVIGIFFMSKAYDFFDKLSDKYMGYIHKNGYYLGKSDAIDGYNETLPKNKFVKHSEVVVEIELSKTGIIKLATKKPFSITLIELLKNKDDIIKARETLELPDLDVIYGYNVALTNYDYDKEHQYIKLARDYVDPKYWDTFWGNRLLQKLPYNNPYQLSIHTSNDALNGRTIGGKATDYYTNNLEVDIYA